MILSWMNLLSLAATFAALGAAVMCLGLLGRRVGDHPYCRRCGFDLFGRGSDSHVCSECGADLTRPRAMVVGLRVRRKRLGWAGAALLVPTMVVLSIFGYGAAKGVDWQKHKPVWWLAREAESKDVALRDAALAELLGRYTAGQLDRDQMSDLLGRGLTAQADPQRPWAALWGDLIERARADGQVSDEQWKRYAAQAAAGSVVVRFRSKMRRTDPVPYRVESAVARVGSHRLLQRQWSLKGLTVDGTELPIAATAAGSSGFGEQSGISWDAGRLRPVFQDLKLGWHTGFVRVSVEAAPLSSGPARIGPRGTLPISSRLTRRADPVATVELTIPLMFELVGPEELAVELVRDPQLRPAVERALKVDHARSISSTVMLDLSWHDAPLALCFQALIRDGSKEWLIGPVLVRPDSSSGVGAASRIALSRMLQGPDGRWQTGLESEKVDVIFRPDPEAAARTTDIHFCWGEEVILKDIPVEHTLRRAHLPHPELEPQFDASGVPLLQSR